MQGLLKRYNWQYAKFGFILAKIDFKVIFKPSKLDRGMYLDIVHLCIVVIERLTAQIYSQGFLGRDECYRYWKTRMKGFQC